MLSFEGSAKTRKKASKQPVSRDSSVCINGNDTVLDVTGITEAHSIPSLRTKKRKRKNWDVKDEIKQIVQLENSTKKKQAKSDPDLGTVSLEQRSVEGQSKAILSANDENGVEEERESKEGDTSWVQRASWKSLVGETGRVAFSLGSILGNVDPSLLSMGQPSIEVQSGNDVSAWIDGTNSSPLLKPNHQLEPAHVWKKSSALKDFRSQDGFGLSIQLCVGNDDAQGGFRGTTECGRTKRPDHKKAFQNLHENGADKLCTFMRSEKYEQDWLEAKRAVKEIFKRTRKDALRSIKMLHIRQTT